MLVWKVRRTLRTKMPRAELELRLGAASSQVTLSCKTSSSDWRVSKRASGESIFRIDRTSWCASAWPSGGWS
eukprot:760499-Hanusia_phi.AAC.2